MRPLVLVLEGEALIAMDVTHVLDAAGYRVVTIASASKAVDWPGGNGPDIAVLDVSLPDGDFAPVAAELRERGIPFVVHSGSVAEEFAGTAFAGATRITKPAQMEELLTAVRATQPL